MPTDERPTSRSVGIVVGIGDEGLEASRAAVRLGAEESRLRQVPLRLVHGSRPAGREAPVSTPAMEYRQQRGRRLVNGAARDLAGTPLGHDLEILAESSPRTGVDLLLALGRSAAMLVLQRDDGWGVATGPTLRAVTAAGVCPTLVTRSGRSTGDVGVLVVLDRRHDPGPTIALAFAEAALHGTGITVLEGRAVGAAARAAIRSAGVEHPGVAVRLVEIDPVQPVEQVRQVSREAVLMVVVRPAASGAAWTAWTATAAADAATCPVLTVAAGA